MAGSKDNDWRAMFYFLKKSWIEITEILSWRDVEDKRRGADFSISDDIVNENLEKMDWSKFEYTYERAELEKPLIPKCANSKIKRVFAFLSCPNYIVSYSLNMIFHCEWIRRRDSRDHRNWQELLEYENIIDKNEGTRKSHS